MQQVNKIKYQKNKNKNKNERHIVVSEINYNQLKSMGQMGDSFDKVLSNLLSKENKNSPCNLEEITKFT
jgi:predicted CopG family antitoxin